MVNPFTPSFGQIPAHMAGRSFLIDEITHAFDNGISDPNLCTIFSGARGTGKTALLSYFANAAEQRSWISVSTSAMPGMLVDIEEQTLRKGAEFLDPSAHAHLKGITIGQFVGLEWDREQKPRLNWRSRMTTILEALNEKEIGLLITVDEVNPKLDEMVQLATVYQHFVRENRKVSLLMAGLPFRVSALLNGKSISFLRRAGQHHLGSIENYEVEFAFKQTVEQSGKTITKEALHRAADSIMGFPFMMQLVGFRAWQAVGPRREITEDDIATGAALAENDMKTRVLRATLDELSERDLDFLKALLDLGKPSTTAEIANHLRRTTSHASTYRRRLLEQGVIEMKGRYKCDFSLPMLKEYLPEYLEMNAEY